MMASFSPNRSWTSVLPTISKLQNRDRGDIIANDNTTLRDVFITNLLTAVNTTPTSNITRHPVPDTVSPTGISFTSTVVVTGLLCITIIITLFGNNIALAAFFVSRELRKITYYFIVNLCISDLTVAVLSMPFWISFVITGWPNNQSGAIYTFWLCLDVFCGSWSIMSLAMISIERYICIVYSLQYPMLVTKARAVGMVVFVLLYSTLASLLRFLKPFMYPKVASSICIFVAVYVVPVLIKIYTYAGIYKEARVQQKFMHDKKRNKKRFDEERELMLSIELERKRADEINRNEVEYGENPGEISCDVNRSLTPEDEKDEWKLKTRKKKNKKRKQRKCDGKSQSDRSVQSGSTQGAKSEIGKKVRKVDALAMTTINHKMQVSYSAKRESQVKETSEVFEDGPMIVSKVSQSEIICAGEETEDEVVEMVLKDDRKIALKVDQDGISVDDRVLLESGLSKFCEEGYGYDSSRLIHSTSSCAKEETDQNNSSRAVANQSFCSDKELARGISSNAKDTDGVCPRKELFQSFSSEAEETQSTWPKEESANSICRKEEHIDQQCYISSSIEDNSKTMNSCVIQSGAVCYRVVQNDTHGRVVQNETCGPIVQNDKVGGKVVQSGALCGSVVHQEQIHDDSRIDETGHKKLQKSNSSSDNRSVSDTTGYTRSTNSKYKRFLKSGSLAEIKNKSLLRLRRIQRELREAKIVGLIIGTFLLMWTPFMLVVFLYGLGVDVSMDIVMVVKCLHYLNSAVNPILYVLLNRIFRKAVMKVLRKMGVFKAKQRIDYY